jgi:hypothetical protein
VSTQVKVCDFNLLRMVAQQQQQLAPKSPTSGLPVVAPHSFLCPLLLPLSHITAGQGVRLQPVAHDGAAAATRP